MSGRDAVRRPNREGMSLIELVIALTIFGIVITSAVAFAARENAAFQTAVQRISALRNVRYAVTMLVQDLETTGTNVPINQPSLVYGDDDVVVFSADYATNVSPDPFAVFYDPDAPNGQVQAPAVPFVVPTTAVTVADSLYSFAGMSSPAEMLVFYFAPDTTTVRDDDHILFRQVNDGAPEPIARNLLRLSGQPFFSYERHVEDGLGATRLEPVPTSALPLWHEEPIHLSPADTGAVSWPDSVRAVRLSIGGSNGLEGDLERRVETSRLIALPNAGRRAQDTCGSAPLLGSSFEAVATSLASGDPAIELSWDPAVDEAGGEGDVVRYVIWRRLNGSGDWGDPYLAIPAGAAAYTYVEASVQAGTIYQFALAAQDCTPSLSTLEASSWVVVP